MNPFGFYVASKGYTPEPGVARQKKSGFRQLRLLPPSVETAPFPVHPQGFEPWTH